MSEPYKDEWYVYILLCAKNLRGGEGERTTVHVGIAKNVTRRMIDHKMGRVKATRGGRIELQGYYGPMSGRKARQKEIRMKRLSRKRKLDAARHWRRARFEKELHP